MTDATHTFRMRLFLVSGRVDEFYQSDEEQIRLNLPVIAPDSVFENPLLIVAGAHRTTTYRTAEILRIEVESERIMWTFSRQLEECELIGEAEFEVEHAKRRDMPRETKRIAGSKFRDLVEFHDVKGGVFHVRIAGVVPPSAARIHVTEAIAEDSYLYSRRNHTHVLFNTKNLVSIALFPGPPVVPYDSVKAHHVG